MDSKSGMVPKRSWHMPKKINYAGDKSVDVYWNFNFAEWQKERSMISLQK